MRRANAWIDRLTNRVVLVPTIAAHTNNETCDSGEDRASSNMAVYDLKILEEGSTCWRLGCAKRAAVLIDGAAYFAALREALLKAQRSVFIVGWDIDSRVEILGEEPKPDDDAPTKLGELLTYLVDRRPQLQIHLLLWDYSVVYALEREPLPSINLDWATPRQIKVCLDDVLPLGASHHQKIVVIDDAVAFCGGLDLTIRRWDTTEHRPEHPRRRDPDGKAYDPFHDLQMCVDGEAAIALADLVRERWLEAACEAVDKNEPAGDAWPEDLVPDFENLDIAVARTVPPLDDTSGVREVEALYLAAIDRAERMIYIENQFLTASAVSEGLARRLSESPNLEVLLVSPRDHDSWLEARSMKAGRIRFMQRLQEPEISDRVRLVHPATTADGAERAVMVHAKLMIVDDVFLRIGSSNLNKRSMGLDTECDLAVEAADDDQRRSIAGIRNRLLGEHLGVPASTVAETLEEQGSLLKAIDALSGGERTLQPILDEGDYADPVSETVAGLADPERPIEASGYVGDMFGGQPAKRVLGRIGTLTLVGLAVVALALVWRLTPLSEITDSDTLRSLLTELGASQYVPLAVLGLFIVGGLIVFPVTVLIALTAMVFEPWWALVYAAIGSLMSATITYQVGALAGRKHLRDIMGRRLNRISRALARKGILSVMAIRFVPVAPFTLINLVAGISHIRFKDYILGTILGMAPGLLVITTLGNRIAEVLTEPSAGQIALLAVVVCLWFGMSIGLQFVVSRMRSAGSA